MVVRAGRGASLVAAVAAVVVVLGACSTFERSGYQFLRSPSTGTYLKVPEDWEVFSRQEIDEVMVKEGLGSADAFPFLSVFDGADDPSVYFDPVGDAPKGIVRVRDLEPAERDFTSFATARQEIFKELNDQVAAGDYQLLQATEVESGPARGQRVVFSLADEETGRTFVVDQTSLVDLDAGRLHFLAVACTSACYERHQDQIDEVVTSLTIKER